MVYTVSPRSPHRQKIQLLRACGALNPHADKVRHPLFCDHAFFDPHDLVQLKYEAIRAVEVEGCPILHAARQFGLSRPTIYQARQQFRQEGIEGLLARKRGPKNPRKLTPEVRRHLEELVAGRPELKAPALAERLRKRFGVQLHPRTVEKALQKKGRQTP